MLEKFPQTTLQGFHSGILVCPHTNFQSKLSAACDYFLWLLGGEKTISRMRTPASTQATPLHYNYLMDFFGVIGLKCINNEQYWIQIERLLLSNTFFSWFQKDLKPRLPNYNNTHVNITYLETFWSSLIKMNFKLKVSKLRNSIEIFAISYLIAGSYK